MSVKRLTKDKIQIVRVSMALLVAGYGFMQLLNGGSQISVK